MGPQVETEVLVSQKHWELLRDALDLWAIVALAFIILPGAMLLWCHLYGGP